MEFLIFFAFFALVIVGIVFGVIQAQKRRKELTAWCESKGFTFDPGSDYALDDRYGKFTCLRQGSNRYGYNLMKGRLNKRGVFAFDYHYETHSTDSKGNRKTHNHYFSAVIINSGLPLKPLFIRPEGFFDRVTEFFGYDDIDFESSEFSRKFYVQSPDKRWAYDVIHQETMEFLLSAPTFTIDIQDSEILVYRSGTFSIKEFEDAIGVVEGILGRIPEYLLREWKEGN